MVPRRGFGPPTHALRNLVLKSPVTAQTAIRRARIDQKLQRVGEGYDGWKGDTHAGPRISKRLAVGLRPDKTGFIVWDSALTGFGVRVRSYGAMSYVVV
jgi:hypothetical protein